MRKSALLGGTARIIREPSRKEMQDAMLRRMGAGHILDGQEAPEAPSGRAIPSRKRNRKG